MSQFQEAPLWYRRFMKILLPSFCCNMAQVFGISYFGWTFGRLVAEKYQHWPARIDVTHQLFVFFFFVLVDKRVPWESGTMYLK